MNCEFWINGIPVEHSNEDLFELLLCFHNDIYFDDELLTIDLPHKAIKVVFVGKDAYNDAFAAMEQLNNTIIGDSIISFQIIHDSPKFATPPPCTPAPAIPASTTIVRKAPGDDAVDSEGAPIERTITLESSTSFPSENAQGWSNMEKVTVYFIGSNGKWIEKSTEAKIRLKPFSQGGFRNAYLLYTKDGKKMVAKQSKYTNKYNSFEYHKKDVQAQQFLNEVVNAFNKDLLEANFEQHYLAALPAFVYEFTSRPAQDKFFCVEPYIVGTHEKYNSNSGQIAVPAVGPNALSHWTYQYTNPSRMILDIQGFGNILTDPQICTAVPCPQFNTVGNGGSSRMETFFANHICNEVCKKLGLKEESNHGIKETVPPAPAVKLFCHQCLQEWSPNIKVILKTGNSNGLLLNWCDSCAAAEKEARCLKCNLKFKYPPFLFHCTQEDEPTVCSRCKQLQNE